MHSCSIHSCSRHSCSMHWWSRKSMALGSKLVCQLSKYNQQNDMSKYLIFEVHFKLLNCWNYSAKNKRKHLKFPMNLKSQSFFWLSNPSHFNDPCIHHSSSFIHPSFIINHSLLTSLNFFSCKWDSTVPQFFFY